MDDPSERPAGAATVGLVLVSHSRQLAEGAAELARAMAGEEVQIVPAGGMEPPETALGTDASRVAGAIDEAWSEAGVLVLMDLGSALLSAEMALEFLPEERRPGVLLTSAPLVEGAVAAAVAARLGQDLRQVREEALGALGAKAAQLDGTEPAPAEAPEPAPAVLGGQGLEITVPVDLPLGLHARPASRLVRASAGLQAQVVASNASTGAGPVSATSFNALARLQVRSGQLLRVHAEGPDAARVIAAVKELAERRFDEPREEEAAPAPVPPPAAQRPAREGELVGLAASGGTAVGPLERLGEVEFEIPERPTGGPREELEQLDQALSRTRVELELLRDSTRVRAGAYEGAIVDALLLFLDDPELLQPTRELIAAGGISAAAAWARTVARVKAEWEAMEDPRTRLRAGDLEGVSRKVLGQLCGGGAATMTGRGILVAQDLTPTDTAGLDRDQVLAIATAGGGPTSHSAILARAMGIPAVVALGPPLLEIAAGTEVLLDGDQGLLVVAPSAEQVSASQARAAAAASGARRARELSQGPAVTRDGLAVPVVANIGSVEDAVQARAAGADGVGLLRTEFLFLKAAEMPDVEAQARAYGAIAEALEGRPVTVRTLDVGADKHLPYLQQGAEDNPALGLRGLRLGLSRPELLRAQLQAVVRVARRHPLRLMFPMVSTVDEVRAARGVLAQALEAEGVGPDDIRLEVGVMVEVPAAALSAAALAEPADFFSLGTNDLSQYALAADRTNGEVSGLADALHPAVLRLIASAVAGAARRGREVAVCGELAGQPGAAELLLGLGVRELSVAVPLVAGVKEAVRRVELGAARRLARRALALADAEGVRSLLSARRGR